MNKLTKDNIQLQPGDQMQYRGVTIQFMYDPAGNQNITLFNGKLIEFGTDNTQYRDDMKLLIDDHLDTITKFDQGDGPQDLYGSKLEWFQNGGFRDIRLKYRGRVLKVYTNVSNVDVVQADAEKYLRMYVHQLLLN